MYMYISTPAIYCEQVVYQVVIHELCDQADSLMICVTQEQNALVLSVELGLACALA